MNRTRVLSQVLSGVFLGSLAACGGDLTQPIAPHHPAALRSSQVGAYDCAVDQSEIPVTECQALVAFYTSTNGSSWLSNQGWLASSTPCIRLRTSCME